MIYILVLLVVVLLGEVFLVRKGMKAARNAAFPRGGAGQPPAVKAARPNKRTQRESVEDEPSPEPSPVSEPPALLPAEKYPNVVEFPDRSRTKEPTDLRREIRGKTSSQLVQEKSMLEIIQDIRGKNDQNESPGVPSAETPPDAEQPAVEPHNVESAPAAPAEEAKTFETLEDLDGDEATDFDDIDLEQLDDESGHAPEAGAAPETTPEVGANAKSAALSAASLDELLKTGIKYVKQGKLHEGIATLERAVNAAPDRAEAHFNLGIAYTMQDAVHKAIHAYQKAIALDPMYGKAFFNLGTLYLKQGQIEQAIDKLEQAVNLVSDPMKALWNLYEAYRSKELFSKALFTLKQLIRIEPDDASLHNHLGICYVKLGDYAKAISSWKQSITLGASSHLVYYNLGKTYELCGQFAAAIEQYEQFLAIQPTDAAWEELSEEVQERIDNLQAYSK